MPKITQLGSGKVSTGVQIFIKEEREGEGGHTLGKGRREKAGEGKGPLLTKTKLGVRGWGSEMWGTRELLRRGWSHRQQRSTHLDSLDPLCGSRSGSME